MIEIKYFGMPFSDTGNSGGRLKTLDEIEPLAKSTLKPGQTLEGYVNGVRVARWHCHPHPGGTYEIYGYNDEDLLDIGRSVVKNKNNHTKEEVFSDNYNALSVLINGMRDELVEILTEKGIEGGIADQVVDILCNMGNSDKDCLTLSYSIQ